MEYMDREVEIRDRLRQMRLEINAALRELDKPRKAAIRYPNAHGHVLAIAHVHAARVEQLLAELSQEAVAGDKRLEAFEAANKKHPLPLSGER